MLKTTYDSETGATSIIKGHKFHNEFGLFVDSNDKNKINNCIQLYLSERYWSFQCMKHGCEFHEKCEACLVSHQYDRKADKNNYFNLKRRVDYLIKQGYTYILPVDNQYFNNTSVVSYIEVH